MRHAYKRMDDRNITAAEVKEVLINGEEIEDYPSDKPLPSALFMATVKGRHLHVVVALDSLNNYTCVITVYEAWVR